jgi:hypothetical protein
MIASLFYSKVANACKQCGNSVHMQPSVIMAQLGNETGYQIGPHLNLTNIKYFAPGTGYQNGIYYLGNDMIKGGPRIAYESYATIEQWGKAYVHVLNLSAYKSCHGLPTYIDTCHALGNSPFAESGYRYGPPYHGTRGQVLIDMINSAHLTKYDVGYNPKGGAPMISNNNTNAVKDAQKEQQAKIDNAKIVAKQKATDLAKANAIKAQAVLNKAKLTKDKTAIANAQKNVNAQKKVSPTITPSKKFVLKSGFGVLGLLVTMMFLRNGYDL